MKEDKINLFREVISLRNYAVQTIETYLKSVKLFLKFTGLHKPTQDSLFKFALHLKKKDLSYSHIKNSVMAVKLYSNIIFGQELNSTFLSKY